MQLQLLVAHAPGSPPSGQLLCLAAQAQPTDAVVPRQYISTLQLRSLLKQMAFAFSYLLHCANLKRQHCGCCKAPASFTSRRIRTACLQQAPHTTAHLDGCPVVGCCVWQHRLNRCNARHNRLHAPPQQGSHCKVVGASTVCKRLALALEVDLQM
jgi:hypothetical protein